jgi:hypothetical protein
MILLKKSIYQRVDQVADRVYDSRTPTDKAYPYVNIRYPTIGENDESFRQSVIVEIDIWDNETDTTALDTLTDSIDTALNRVVDTTLFYRVLRLNPYRFELDEPDENIRRRQLRYQILQFREV